MLSWLYARRCRRREPRRCRGCALAQEWALEALDVAALIALAPSPELCGELLHETAREEARARLAAPRVADVRALRQACVAHARAAGLARLAGSAAFAGLATAQRRGSLPRSTPATPSTPRAAREPPPSISREELLHACSRCHSYALDGRRPAMRPAGAPPRPAPPLLVWRMSPPTRRRTRRRRRWRGHRRRRRGGRAAALAPGSTPQAVLAHWPVASLLFDARAAAPAGASARARPPPRGRGRR